MSKTTKIIEAINNIQLSRERKKFSRMYSNPRLEPYYLDKREDLGYILSEQYYDEYLNHESSDILSQNLNEEEYLEEAYDINCGDTSCEYPNNYENDDYFDDQLINNKKINSVFIEYRRIKEEQEFMEKHENKCKKKSIIVKETYSDYLNSLLARDLTTYYKIKDQWMYDLISGITIKPNEKIIYQDNYFLLIADKNWINFDDLESIHLLMIPRDITLRTLRSLKKKDIGLLEYMKKNTLSILKNYYGLKQENFIMYFHYTPSIYHLHVHVRNSNHKNKINLINSYDLDTVIFNLSIKSDYYQTIELNIRKYI